MNTASNSKEQQYLRHGKKQRQRRKWISQKGSKTVASQKREYLVSYTRTVRLVEDKKRNRFTNYEAT